ncbi:hypothetical protein TNCV_4607091 [Trichonephila clavipes]|nr:hypothetical protein TNCV_4607091 [Trichonephila clavipes]
MASLGHQSLPPTNIGRVDEEMASPGERLSQTERRKRLGICWTLATFVVVVVRVFIRFIVDRVGFFLYRSHNLVIA